jgi:hypothetical protein
MAKGKKALGNVDSEDKEFLPYQWWYVSAPLKKAVRAFTIPLDTTACALFLERLAYHTEAGRVKSLFVGTIQLKYVELPFIVGQLEKELAADYTGLGGLEKIML